MGDRFKRATADAEADIRERFGDTPGSRAIIRAERTVQLLNRVSNCLDVSRSHLDRLPSRARLGRVLEKIRLAKAYAHNWIELTLGKAQKIEESLDAAETALELLCECVDCPGDAAPVSAFIQGDQLVVLGYPSELDDSHSCDAMGCGQSHVLYRFPLGETADG